MSRHYTEDQVIYRIMSRLVIDKNGCWIWQKSKNAYGYGQMNCNGKIFLVHRRVYEYAVGPIPYKLCVLHNCPYGDNRACCNPNHMWLGTRPDNSRDMALKNRIPYGENCNRSKITELEAVNIFRDYHCCNLDTDQIKQKYGVCRKTVDRIVGRRFWIRATQQITDQLIKEALGDS